MAHQETLLEAPPGFVPTHSQMLAAQAIVNIFETGEVLGDYGQVTVIDGDSGHLTYGRSQTTLGSGSLHRLIASYCANPGAAFARRLDPYLPRLQARDRDLDAEHKLHNVLRAAADDRIMRETQDRFFDDHYWQPALTAAAAAAISTPLGVAVVYDSLVHGSWAAMKQRTDAHGTLKTIGERAWIGTYVPVRREWLATNERMDLRATVYRMDAFQRLIDLALWGLELPLVVRAREISSLTLAGLPPGCYDGPQPGTRALSLETPLQRGLDVRLVQLGLSDTGADVRADGVLGRATANAVKAHQLKAHLPATGVADKALIAALVAGVFG